MIEGRLSVAGVVLRTALKRRLAQLRDCLGRSVGLPLRRSFIERVLKAWRVRREAHFRHHIRGLEWGSARVAEPVALNPTGLGARKNSRKMRSDDRAAV